MDEADRDAAIAQYAGAHRRSIEEQGLFLKAVTAIAGPAEGVSIKFPDRRVDHEIELGVVIGNQGADIPEQRALERVAGYTIALDMVVRGPEDRSFRKSLDSFAVLGPWLVTPDEVGDPGSLGFTLSVNGEVRQHGNRRDMILGVPRLVAWASSFYTLYPGDVLDDGHLRRRRSGDPWRCNHRRVRAYRDHAGRCEGVAETRTAVRHAGRAILVASVLIFGVFTLATTRAGTFDLLFAARLGAGLAAFAFSFAGPVNRPTSPAALRAPG